MTRFPIRICLLGVLGIFLCGFLPFGYFRVHDRKNALAQIDRLGGKVVFSKYTGPDWIPFLIGEDAFKALLTIESVSLDGAHVPDHQLSDIVNVLRPQELSLRDCGVNSDELRKIVGYDDLKMLDLSNMHISEESTGWICQFRGLQYLFLERSDMDTESFQQIRERLPHCEVFGP